MSRENSHNHLREDKKEIQGTLKRALYKHTEISFVYLHGSFLETDEFGDIDIALYLKDLPPSILEYELRMETELLKFVGGRIVDVRVLNTSPLSFRFNVIKNGTPLIVRNDDERADFQETTLSRYFDFAPYRDIYLKETLGLEV